MLGGPWSPVVRARVRGRVRAQRWQGQVLTVLGHAEEGLLPEVTGAHPSVGLVLPELAEGLG